MDRVPRLLIPVRTWEPLPGRFACPATLLVHAPLPADAAAVETLRAELAQQGRSLRPADAVRAHLVLRRDPAIGPREAYRLHIARDRVELSAPAAAGAYYGIQTLRELLRLDSAALPCGRIDDAPTFARRGIYHDCARGKVPSVATVKALVEQLAHWKLNELQLYIENTFTFAKHPAIGAGFSPYTPADLLAIQTHCRRHHVRFVPSLTSFGHMEKILALDAYCGLGEMPGWRGHPGGSTLYPADPRSIRLMADLYAEFLPLFEAEDFNACGDEPWELGKGRSLRRARKVGVGTVYLDFILKLKALCDRHGKRMNLWGDIVLDHPEILNRLPRDIVMLNWDYDAAGRRIPRTAEIAAHGLALVCCPGTNAWNSHGSRLAQALDNARVFAAEALRNGAEGLLNTDWGDNGHRNFLAASLCSFAHGAAHAWRPAGVDERSHVARFARQTFGDADGALAGAISTLGGANLGRNANDSWTYYALVESLHAPRALPRGYCQGHPVIDHDPVPGGVPEDFAAQRRALRFTAPATGLSPFLALALEEYAAAARMDAAAADRFALARAVRAGQRIPRRRAAAHAADMAHIEADFVRLWRARNRPSRLADNRAGLRAARREAEALARA